MPIVRVTLLALLFPLFSPSGFPAGSLVGETIPSLQLKDGRVLRNVIFVSIASSTVMAKWEGGRGTIPLSQLPDGIRKDIAPPLRPRMILSTPTAPEHKAAVGDSQIAADDVVARLNAENAEALKRPEPTRPSPPQPLEGSIGASDGPPRVIRGQIAVTNGGGAIIQFEGVTVRVVGAAEFPQLYTRAIEAINPLIEYYSTMSIRARARGQFEIARIYLDDASAAIATCWNLFPSSPQTQTDAHGAFELKHTLQEPFIILATTSLRAGNETERYKWRIPSSDVPPDGSILLSNANVVPGRFKWNGSR